MIEKFTKYKKYIISLAIVMMLSTLFLEINYLMKHKKDEPLPEVKLRKINKTKTFAIMVQNGDGYEEYSSDDNRWPGADYVFKEARCIDNNGSLVNDAITFVDGKATLTTNKTIYCTLYFDENSKAEITNADKICDMGTSMSIEFTTSGPVGEYYYSTNGKDFTKGSENIYSIQRIEAGTNQKIYAYVTDSDGKKSAIKEYDFTAKTLRSPITASELRANNPKDLSTTIQGNMYRYQAAPADANAAAQMTNWIIFGAECTNEFAKLNEEEKIDKYMYRIIGITEEGQMYLIKETFLKEGTNTGFVWDDVYQITGTGGDSCENGICPEWNEADLFQRINGTANGSKAGEGNNNDNLDDNTDIFVDSAQYDYLKSGDSNGGEASEWYNLIANHEWMYGDTNEYNTTSSYNGNYMYQVETGKSKTKHYVQQPVGSATVVEEQYIWPNTNKLKAKISLMYIHDYIYSYFDGLIEESRGNPQNKDIAKNSWLFFQKDGYNISPAYEWLSTRLGVGSTSGIDVRALRVGYGGDLYSHSLPTVNGVRPVFYLESKAKIVDGDGTQKNPYILS